MAIRMIGDWKKALKLMKTAGRRFGPAAEKALRREAINAQGIIRGNIKEGPKPAQSPQTAATGGRGKPLNRSGTMRQSVNVVQKGQLNFFIGIPRAEGSYNIAVIHEEGAIVVQVLSDKMRAFLIANLPGDAPVGGGGNIVIVTKIPARPFVAPAFVEVQLGFETRFERSFANALRGDYGRI